MAKALNTMIQSGGGLLKSAKSAFDQENEDELKKASKQQGILTPTSPLGASSLGVSPDSQKMAGTGQQKMGISQQIATLASDNSLAPKEATEQEKQKRTQANKLQQMGQAGTGLKDRVNSIILGDIQKKTAAVSGPEGVASSINNVVTGSGVDATNQARLQKLLSGQELASDVEYEELGKALGITTITGKSLSDKLNADYLVPKSGKLPFKLQENLRVSDVAAVNSDSDATTDWVKELKLGFESEKDLEDFLSGEDISNLTIKELNEKVDNKVAKNFSEIAAAQARMNDPAASMQEKTAARQLLTGLGQAGVLGSEQLAQGSTRDTKKANTVTFMGQEWEPAALATDTIFQTKATDYYSKTPEQKKALKDAAASPSDKAFYDFLDVNEKTLKSIQAKSGETLKKVDENLIAAAGEWQAGTAGLLDDSLMEKINGGQKKPTKIGQKFDATKATQASKILKGANEAQRGIYAGFLKQMPASVEQDILNTDLASLQKMGVWDENPQKLQDNLTRWGWHLADQKFLESPEDNIGTLMGMAGLNEGEAKGLVGALQAIKGTGLGQEASAIFDADGDGNIDSTKDIKARVKSKYGKATDAWRPGTASLGEDLRGLIAAAKEGINKLPEYMRDGEFSTADMETVFSQGVPSFQDYDKLVPAGIKTYTNTTNDAVEKISQNEIRKVLPNPEVFLGDAFANPSESLESMQSGRNQIQAALDKLNGMQIDPRGQEALERTKAAFRMKLAKVDGVLKGKQDEVDKAARDEQDRINREKDREFNRLKNPLSNLPRELQKIEQTGVLPYINSDTIGTGDLLSGSITPAAINTAVKKIKKIGRF